MNSSHILIGERDPFMRRALESILAPRFRLTFTENGEELLARARENPPDIIILEILLPYIDGLQVCRELKSDPATARIPILVFSLLLAKERSRLAGADDFLLKSLREDVLLTRIENLLMQVQKEG